MSTTTSATPGSGRFAGVSAAAPSVSVGGRHQVSAAPTGVVRLCRDRHQWSSMRSATASGTDRPSR